MLARASRDSRARRRARRAADDRLALEHELSHRRRPDAYRFFIDANLIDASTVVVFRGDVVVHPERIDGPRIQVSVPAVYRRTTPGELSLTVRTDRGGNSAPKYIRFVERKMQVVPVLGGRESPGMRIPVTTTRP